MSKPVVLIVDDETGVRESVRMVLKDTYEPVLIDTGEAAVAWLADKRASLMFLDILMPGMDGLEALEKIRERDPALPVVMLTATKTVKIRGHRDEARCVRLPHQAVRRRRAALGRAARDRECEPTARSPAAARRSRQALQLRQHHRRIVGAQGRLQDRRRRGAAEDDGADHRRVVLRTQARIRDLAPGDVLEVQCTDHGVLADIPAWCRINGHRHIDSFERDGVVTIILEVRGDVDHQRRS